MTRLVRVHLGEAPGQFRLGLDGCAAFKRQMRSLLATPERAALVTVAEHGKSWVEALYFDDVPNADGWARRAKELSAEVWATLAERRAVRAR